MPGEEVYVAMDKGPIDETHVLILPIEHYPSSGHMPPSAQAEAEAYLRALEDCFAAQVGQHVDAAMVKPCYCRLCLTWQRHVKGT